MTFSAPSSQPPFGTESRWPPTTTLRSLSPGRVAQMFPAGSVWTSTPGIPASCPRSQSRAVTQRSVQATR